MKKQSHYALKRAAQARAAAHRTRQTTQAELENAVRERIRQDVRGLQIDAGLHTWAGNDAANMINLSGRMCFLVAHAATTEGIDADHPDMRILRGMSEALGDLAARPQDTERHRPSIQAGLTAIDRLLPRLDDINLALAAQELDALLDSTRGMGTEDVRKAMGVTA